MALTWEQIGLASNLARHLRAVNRVARTEIDDHRFTYADLADIWVSDDQQHILLTQNKDPFWLHWTQLGGSWQMVGVHKTRPLAEKAAVEYAVVTSTSPGTYVVARQDANSRLIRVHCQSKEGPELLVNIFSRLGYVATVEKVA